MNAPCLSAPPSTSGPLLSESDFAALARVIHLETGIFMPPGKRALMQSRLAKRLAARGLGSFREYRELVESRSDPDEIGLMISALTTNITRFFREGQHFDDLREKVLPGLLAQARAGGRIRMWSAGCSTGEEPYSMALSVLALCPEAPRLNIRILATDLDPVVIATAKAARYPAAALANLPDDVATGASRPDKADPEFVRIREDARKLISFRVLNLLHDWPFGGQFDVIMCRNVVIYFDAETRDRLWTRFAALQPSGARIYVGHSERIAGEVGALYVPSGITAYTRTETPPPGRGRSIAK